MYSHSQGRPDDLPVTAQVATVNEINATIFNA